MKKIKAWISNGNEKNSEPEICARLGCTSQLPILLLHSTSPRSVSEINVLVNFSFTIPDESCLLTLKRVDLLVGCLIVQNSLDALLFLFVGVLEQNRGQRSKF